MKNLYQSGIFRTLATAAVLSMPCAYAQAQFTLQILHASDLEGGVSAIDRAPNFAAIIEGLEDDFTNTVILSAGDNYIPGPFFSASADISLRPVLQDFYDDYYGGIAANDLREGVGRVDISIMNAIGFDASALGNHEFDAGTSTIAEIIGASFSGGNVRWIGNQFPYLSANLNFSGDGSLNPLVVNTIENTSFFKSDPATLVPGSKKSIAPSALIERGGELIGVVGATTPILQSISSPGPTTIQNPGAGTNNMAELASILQPYIDALTAAGSNKIILISHLQQIQLEEELALLLNDVDIIIAGGSDAILANPGDVLNPGDVIDDPYPIQTVNADGDPVLIVSTDGEYSYVGRLIFDFDANGIVIPASIDPLSGPYATNDAIVTGIWGNYADAFTFGSKGYWVNELTEAVEDVVILKDANIFGSTDVFLEGRRDAVRTEETNLGNFTADANLWFAKQVDANTVVSIKNGGGIRAAIGEVVQISDDVYEFLPPQANPLSGKEEGEISQLDIENSMRFNNALSILTLSATGLKAVLEHGVAAWTPSSTPGQFAQVGGVRFSFDPSLPAGNRIQSAILIDDNDEQIEVLVENGVVAGDPARDIRVVTLSFLATGGDSYPFPALATDIVNLQGSVPQAIIDAGVAEFAAAGTEQDAFAEYAAEFFTNSPFNLEDTPASEDMRIQNLAFRADAVIQGDLCTGGEVLMYNPGLQSNGTPITNPLRNDPSKALGVPQLDNDYNFVSLGYAGELILGFNSPAAFNGPGDDLLVAETTFNNEVFDTYPESAEVFVTQDGINFYSVGMLTTNEAATFEIDDAGQGFTFITAVKIVDTTPMGSVSFDAFDVDGIEALNGCGPIPEIITGECYATEVVEYLPGTQANFLPIPVNRSDASQALGEPEDTDAMVFVTLGYGGSLTLGFDGSVPNGPGADLEIVETTFNFSTCENYPEYAEVYLSQNGTDFFLAGTICRADNMIDIDDAGQGFAYIDFVKIVNNDMLSTSPDGFDVDGVRAIHNCEDDDLPGTALITAEDVSVLSSQPNPTNGPSVAVFTVVETAPTTLEVFDMNGRNVSTLFNQVANAGQEYRVNFEGTFLPNGVYIYRLTSGMDVIIDKMMIAR